MTQTRVRNDGAKMKQTNVLRFCVTHAQTSKLIKSRQEPV